MADVNKQACLNNKFKRKRKKSFLKTQIRHGKRGRYGRGSQLSEDNYQYFIRIYEVLRASKEDTESLENLSENVIEEIKDKEFETCSNQLGSRVIEELLPFMSDSSLTKLAESLGEKLRVAFCDPFASHVIQGVIKTTTNRENSEFSGILIKYSNFGLNNIEEFIFDPYGNRVLRTIFWCLNGFPVKGEDEKALVQKKVPEVLQNILHDFVNTLINWPQLNDIIYQDLTSGCIQNLLLSLKDDLKLSKKIIKRLIELCKDKKLDLNENKNNGLLRLVEVALSCPLPTLYHKLYKLFFKNHIIELAKSNVGNFSIQKLILNCPEQETFHEIFENLSENFPKICHNSGILVAMAKTCRRLKTKTGEFTKLLLTTLDCFEPKGKRINAAKCIISLSKIEDDETDSWKIHINGSLIFQELLLSSRPEILTTSLIGLSTDCLMKIFLDPRGSHIADAFAKSDTVGEKNKGKLCAKFQGKFTALASTKHGSRSFDALWSTVTDSRHKEGIMDELKKEQSKLLSSTCGRIIAQKYKLDVYREDPKKWIKFKL